MAEIKDGGAIEEIKDFFARQADLTGQRSQMKSQLLNVGYEELTPSAGQVANFGGMLAPGAGYIDAAGEYPALPSYDQPFTEALSGEPYPSMAENLQRGGWGGYFDAAMQGLGVAGDTLYAAPIIGPILGTGVKAVAAAGKAARASKGIAALDTTKQMLRAAVNRFARDDSGFVSPTIQALIEGAPANLKGQGIIEWAKANAKPKELEFLGLDEFVAANPNATTREVVEGISGNKVRVSKNIRGGGDIREVLEFERTIPETDPLTGSSLWDPEWEWIMQDLDKGDELLKKQVLDHYHQSQDVVKVGSYEDIPASMLDEVIEGYAKDLYMLDPLEMLQPPGFGSGTFAFGSEDAGYQLFVDGNRVTNSDNIAYSRTEAEIQLQQELGLEDMGQPQYGFGEGTEFKTFVDKSLPGGSNYREVVFNWDNAPVTHNIGHFDDDTQIAHALIRDRKLSDGTDSLHIDELQSDLHTAGSRGGYQLPEKLRIEEVNKIEEFLEGSGQTMKPKVDDVGTLFGTVYSPQLDKNFIFVRDGDEFLGTLPLSDIERIASALRAGQNPFALRFDEVVFNLKANALVESLGVEKIYELADLVKPLVKSGPVPNYPYKDDWYDMGLKNLLLQAIEEGKPALSISGSAPMKARYSDRPATFYEMLYDKKIPSAMKKLANRYGGEFEKGSLDLANTFGEKGIIIPTVAEQIENATANIIRITPKMKEKILKEGLQSFGTGGIVDSGIARLKINHAKKYAHGGEVISGNQQFIPSQENLQRLLDLRSELDGEAGFRTPLQQRIADIDIFEEGNADPNIKPGYGRAGRRVQPRLSNRPSFNFNPPATDPAFNRGLLGFIGQDPSAFAKGIGIAPFAVAPDLVGLLQAGGNYLANDYISAAFPNANFKPFGEPMSGDPLREWAGFDPMNPQAMLGEIASPMATMAKILGITVKSAIAGAKLVAGTGFDPSLAMTLFHGTPHKFEKFSLDKIGTGEGAQAFGHGLYFAENKGVARSYQNTLTDRGSYSIDGVPVDENMVAHNHLPLQIATNDGDKGLREFIENYDKRIAGGEQLPMDVLDELDFAESLLGKKVARPTGSLYEVEIPDNITNKMLDWDKPLSEQPESVRKALQGVLKDPEPVTVAGGSVRVGLRRRNTLEEATAAYRKRLEGEKGGDIYMQLRQQLGGQEAASKALSEAGIPGIRYKSGQLSGGKGDTSNIVVFNPDDITSVKRDGVLVHESKLGISEGGFLGGSPIEGGIGALPRSNADEISALRAGEFLGGSPTVRKQGTDAFGGYSGYSKSNRAIAAENNGKLPMTHAVKEVALRAGISQKKARSVLSDVGPAEWHHTGKYFRETKYYDIDAAVDREKAQPLIDALKKSGDVSITPDGLEFSGGFESGNREQYNKFFEELAARHNADKRTIERIYYGDWND
jgi:hypothetical protein